MTFDMQLRLQLLPGVGPRLLPRFRDGAFVMTFERSELSIDRDAQLCLQFVERDR